MTNVDSLLSEAYACFEQGLCYDEINDKENCLVMYERGLNLVKEAEKDKKVEKSEVYGNLKQAKYQIEGRMKDLRNLVASASTDGLAEKGKKEEVKSQIRDQLESVGSEEAELVFFIPEGVQLFIIDHDATSVPTYPASLEIFRFSSEKARKENGGAEAFMQVGPWVYPLAPRRTPVLKNDIGAYVVSNPTPENPEMCVGLLLPSDLDKKLVEDFEQILRFYTEMRESMEKELTKEEEARLSHKISTFLIKGGEKIAWGVAQAALKSNAAVSAKSKEWRASMKKTDQPVNISPAVQNGVYYMHKGSKVVAKCTRFLLDKIGDIGVALGKNIAASAEKRLGDSKTGNLVNDTFTVLGGTVTGASTIWIALEDASKTLCRNIANETVDTVNLRYGDSASTTTHHALHAAGHTSLAAFQLWDLGPRSIAGRMARKAGIQIITDMHGKTVPVYKTDLKKE